MKTLNLYEVSFKGLGHSRMLLLVAAATKSRAKKQTLAYSKTVKRVVSVERVGNVNVPLTLAAGL